MNTILEMRLYKLRPGTRDAFDRVFREGALPMLGRHAITVVSCGPSLHDADSYFLIRAYPSLEQREKVLEKFYGSEEWLQNYDEKVMAMIESYNTVVVPASDPAIAAFTQNAA